MTTVVEDFAGAAGDAGLPVGWDWTPIGDVVHAQPGFASGEKDIADGVPHLRMNNITQDGRLTLSLVRRVPTQMVQARHLLQPGDVLFCQTNSAKLVGKTAIFALDGTYAYSNHLCRLRCHPAVLEPSWLAHWLHYLWSSGYFEKNCKAWVNQATVERGTLLATTLPLPPLAEQRRIVAALDAALARLDTVAARLARVPVLLKRYRAAVLAAAVSGRLTEDWRAEHEVEPASALLQRILVERRARWQAEQRAKHAKAGKPPPAGWQSKYQQPQAPDTDGLPELPEGWAWSSLNQLILRSEYGTSVKCTYEANGEPVLRIPNVVTGTIDLNDTKYATQALHLNGDDALQIGDLLVIRTNGSKGLVGSVARVEADFSNHHTFASYLLRFRFIEREVLPSFITIVLRSSEGRRFVDEHAASSAGQHNISLSTLHRMPVPLPPLEEQREIVRRVERLLAFADAAEARVERATAAVARTRQALLAKAFRGELVPQDPTDEPASALLARLRPSGGAQQARARRGRYTVEVQEQPQ